MKTITNLTSKGEPNFQQLNQLETKLKHTHHSQHGCVIQHVCHEAKPRGLGYQNPLSTLDLNKLIDKIFWLWGITLK